MKMKHVLKVIFITACTTVISICDNQNVRASCRCTRKTAKNGYAEIQISKIKLIIEKYHKLKEAKQNTLI